MRWATFSHGGVYMEEVIEEGTIKTLKVHSDSYMDKECNMGQQEVSMTS